MPRVKTDEVVVAGAHIFYEMQGTGPLLLMIAGGAGDADSYGPLLPYLSGYFTVVTYDRRGYTRSPIDSLAAQEVIPIRIQSDDAYRLLSHLSPEPVYVFGSSIGAVIALDLAIRHPDRVRLLVAHEPPLAQLLPDAHQANGLLVNHPDEAPEATIERFAASLGIKRDRFIGTKQSSSRPQQNMAFFLAHEASSVGDFSVELKKLESHSTRIVFAGGEAGRQFFPYICAKQAAERAKSPFLEFPGRHNGYVEYPQEFAQRLLAILNDGIDE